MTDSASADAMTVGANLARLVECSEARAYAGLVEGASAELKRRYGWRCIESDRLTPLWLATTAIHSF